MFKKKKKAKFGRTGYLGNPNLRRVREVIAMSDEQVQEYLACMHSPEYFIEHYMKIVNVDKGLVTIPLWDFQRKMIHMFHENRFSILMTARQVGKSTCVVGYAVHQLLFNDSHAIALLSNKGASASELMAKLKLAYEYLPKWMQQGIVTWNKRSIELENGSKCVSVATSSSSVRGGAYNMVICDEFGFVPENIAIEFFSSTYPVITSGKTTKIIIISTPNGFNLFHRMWKEALEGLNGYAHFSVRWNEVPGRDAKWEQENRIALGDAQFEAEMNLRFLGSQGTLISAMKLGALAHRKPLISRDDHVRIFKPPMKDHQYVITVDTSHGAQLDDSAFIVTDVTQIPYEQVAVFNDNEMPVLQYPALIHATAMYYNEAFVLVEVNDVGLTIAYGLQQDLEYGNLLTTVKTPRGQRIGGGFSPKTQPGLKMTPQAKRIGCANLKAIIEGDKYLVSDYDTIKELSTFIAVGKSFEADSGHKDDLPMCLVLFSWLTSQQYFTDLGTTNIRQAFIDIQQQEFEELPPAGTLTGFGREQSQEEIEDMIGLLG